MRVDIAVCVAKQREVGGTEGGQSMWGRKEKEAAAGPSRASSPPDCRPADWCKSGGGASASKTGPGGA